MSPTCCEPSKENRTVKLFVSNEDAGWVVPIRNENDEVSTGGNTAARFCPFCGVKLKLEHIPFAERAPYGTTKDAPSGCAPTATNAGSKANR